MKFFNSLIFTQDKPQTILKASKFDKFKPLIEDQGQKNGKKVSKIKEAVAKDKKLLSKFNQGAWTSKQSRQYIQCLRIIVANNWELSISENQFLNKMCLAVESRSKKQCLNHHKRNILKFQTFQNIIKNYEESRLKLIIPISPMPSIPSINQNQVQPNKTNINIQGQQSKQMLEKQNKFQDQMDNQILFILFD